MFKIGWLSKAKYVTYVIVPGSYALTIVYDKFGNKISEVQSDVTDGAANAALDLFEEGKELGLDVIEDISDVALDIANAGLDLIEGAGLAIISGAELMYDYGYNKISPHRVEAVTAVTAMLVYITTGVIMFKKIKGAN